MTQSFSVYQVNSALNYTNTPISINFSLLGKRYQEKYFADTVGIYNWRNDILHGNEEYWLYIICNGENYIYVHCVVNITNLNKKLISCFYNLSLRIEKT